MSLLSLLGASQSAVESSDQALQAAEKALTAAQTANKQAKEVLRAVTEAFVREDRKLLVSTNFEGPRQETKEVNFNRIPLMDCETDGDADEVYGCFLSTNKNPVNDIDDEESTEDEETSGQKYLLISSTTDLAADDQRQAIAKANEAELQELGRKVIAILNKLTPQKFDTLVLRFQELPIDSTEKLSLFMELIFEKAVAVDEPSFSVAYASMCGELQKKKVQDADGKEINFRKLLIMRCQQEFEKDYMEGLDREKHVSEMEATTDEDTKKRIKGEFEALERKLRKRSLGNIRYEIIIRHTFLSVELIFYAFLGTE